MFILGHAVVGTRLVRMVRPKLKMRWLVVGALLPDLIDKPLYYGLVLLTGRRGADLGLISSTRTFGHTALFLLFITFIAFAFGKTKPQIGAIFTALAWGVLSHVAIDNLGDLPFWHYGAPVEVVGPSTFDGFMFPLRGAHFPIAPFKSVRDHLLSIRRIYVLTGELLGLAILIWEWRRSKRSAQVP